MTQRELMNTEFLLHTRGLLLSWHLSVVSDGTRGQRLIQHFHIWMLRQVVKTTQVTNEALQLLEELMRREKTRGGASRRHTNEPTRPLGNMETRGREARGRVRRLTSVLPFLTSSKRSSTSARLGSSESTNHIGGVDGYDSCNTDKSTT